MNNLLRYEELVDQHVRHDNKEAAVELLFDLILRHAREKNFEKAEALRERLFEVDPMSLTEIIKSAEIIEEEKNESIDPDHLDVWSGMYDLLTTEEAHTLYLVMKNSTYDTDEPVFRQGELNSKLWFMNHGRLKMFYTLGDRELLLKTLGPGDIAGEDTFFSITVCTTSLITLSQVKLSFLDKDTFTKWKDRYPNLSSTLTDYCLRAGNIQNLLKKKGGDRRSHKRIKMSGDVMFQILNTSGIPLGKAYKGDIADISVGGLSFTIKTSKKNAVLLLARNLNVKFSLARGEYQAEITRTGTITGITDRHLNNYKIHVKFDEILDEVREM